MTVGRTRRDVQPVVGQEVKYITVARTGSEV